jgi:hypothetical protein
MEIDRSTIDIIVRKLSNQFNDSMGVAYLVGEKKSCYSLMGDVSFPEQKPHRGYVESGETEQVIELEKLHSHDKAAIGVVQYNACYEARMGAAEKDIFDELLLRPCLRLIVNKRGEYYQLGDNE